MAMAKLSAAGADLFLAGHLHISHIGHTAARYRIAGHSALVVQAGTVSTRSRGEQPSFNVLRLHRPEISVERLVWDPGRTVFVEAAASVYRHAEQRMDERLVQRKEPGIKPGSVGGESIAGPGVRGLRD